MYYLHRALLTYHSESFRPALTGPWKEAEEGVVTLHDIETSTCRSAPAFARVRVLTSCLSQRLRTLAIHAAPPKQARMGQRNRNRQPQPKRQRRTGATPLPVRQSVCSRRSFRVLSVLLQGRTRSSPRLLVRQISL